MTEYNSYSCATNPVPPTGPATGTGRLALWTVLWALFLAGCPFQPMAAQQVTGTVEKTARFRDASQEGNALKIYNVHGNVAVEGYDGDDIRITAVKEIDADSRSEPDRAVEELRLVVEEEDGLVLVYIDAPFIQVKKTGDRISYNITNREDRYDFRFDITVRVPKRTDIHASTITRGKVAIENTMGRELSASNVNGKVVLKNISGTTVARTVNGDITATYRENPAGNSSYKTVNGTIDVTYPGDLSADIRFKSLHGDLYTDFDNLKRLQARVEADRSARGGTTTYRIDKFAPLRIGEGGPEFSFEVLNGDVYLKRSNS